MLHAPIEITNWSEFRFPNLKVLSMLYRITAVIVNCLGHGHYST